MLAAVIAFGSEVGVTADLGAGTVTLVQDITNSGTANLTGATLTLGSTLLTPVSVSASVKSSAGVERAVAADGCTDAGCALPVIGPGGTATVTVTLALKTSGVVRLDALRGDTVDLTVTNGDLTGTTSVAVAPAVPTIKLSPLTAGVSGDLDVTVTGAANSSLPSRIGVGWNGDRILPATRGSGCTVASGSALDCSADITITDTVPTATVKVPVNPLPDARRDTATISVGRFTAEQPITVTRRFGPISLTGPFQVSATGAALGQACQGAAPAGPKAPTACMTDIPAGASVLWAELVWNWRTDLVPADTEISLFSGADETAGTPLTLGQATGLTSVESARYRTAPIVLDETALAALTAGDAAQLGVSAPEGAIGGWTVVVLWTDASVSSPATVQVDDSLDVVRVDHTLAQLPGTTASLFDLGAPQPTNWLRSWYDAVGGLIGEVVQLTAGAGLSSAEDVVTWSTNDATARGLVVGPVITPR
ncbi:MAG: hypothetical protein WKF57_08520 [Nakamurella sp.]